MVKLFFFIFGLLILQSVFCNGQVTRAEQDSARATPPGGQIPEDTAKKKTGLSKPQRAALYSAILPGLGQAYNHEYWKMPIIYAGAATLGYFWVTNHQQYATFRDAITLRLDGDTGTHDAFEQRYTIEQILRRRDFYRRNRDLTIVISGLVYLLQIADAHVFAHLREFNVADDLTASVAPVILPGYATGFAITLNLK